MATGRAPLRQLMADERGGAFTSRVAEGAPARPCGQPLRPQMKTPAAALRLLLEDERGGARSIRRVIERRQRARAGMCLLL